ncbi:TetR/AcrR family transcriptional regulator [Aurantiacibacter xanthus]|uniref:TetR/AcrR family transcriptional regulator n=1 Tax=Aurantiacibacter xanthus TaxID=1784712 RepID=A0A3A1P4Q5_9SPHN|nr:TetR/AcrR family transcriptional regulator [Aurantiacibacter xanthus]RIV80940.1 TetR/AcrR family transcriptional regulator [Aurantiacibacter xanthus]
MKRRARSEMIEETRGKLIEAARRAFGDVGYAETSMDTFTASAGLTRGALYHHFGDKKGLLLAVAEAIDAEMDQRLAAITDNDADLWQGFLHRCHAYLEMALEQEVQRIVLRDAPSVLGAIYTQASQRQCLTSLSAILTRLMADKTIKRGDPEMLARLINGALVDAALWIGEADVPKHRLDTATASVNLLLSGLKSNG